MREERLSAVDVDVRHIVGCGEGAYGPRLEAYYYLCQQAQRAWFGPCLNTGTDLALVIMVSTFTLHISRIIFTHWAMRSD